MSETHPAPGRAAYDPPESEEAPVYEKAKQETYGTFGPYWCIWVHEGYRSSILCADMYERDADWLLSLLGRRKRWSRAETGCVCLIGGPCPCGADGDDGYCRCCRDDHHDGSCQPAVTAAASSHPHTTAHDSHDKEDT